jgi:PKD repeat protein
MKFRIGIISFLILALPLGAVTEGAGLAINEVAWMGTEVSANDEWLELYNGGDTEIDLAGWVLEAADGTPRIILSGLVAPDSYFVLERTDDETLPGVQADLIYVGGLGNNGEHLFLKDASGRIIDEVAADGSWPAGDNTTKRTMSRLGSAWLNSLEPGGTPGERNYPDGFSPGEAPLEPPSDEEPEEPEGNQNNTSPAPAPSTPSYARGDLVINEFVADPADGEDEWVELYNRGSRTISLDGWFFVEGGGAKTALSGEVPVRGYHVIAKPKGYLNNKGDLLKIMFGDMLIDQVIYGNWEGEDNAPYAADPCSVARRADGPPSSRYGEDFALTCLVTKGSANRFEEKSVGFAMSKEYGYAVVISEIMADPDGPDQEGEFIELHNTGPSAVDLAGWSLADATEKKFKIKEDVIEAGKYKIFRRPETKIALNNGGDKVILFAPDGSLNQSVAYEKALSGGSYCRGEDGIYVWTTRPTPGEPNLIIRPNTAPMPDFSFPDRIVAGEPAIFDASDSSDPDGDDLMFRWDFGDGFTNRLIAPEHTFSQAGNYQVRLEAGDGRATSSVAKKIKVMLADTDYRGIKLLINEFLPDPEDSDLENEWIELYNQGSVSIDLQGWSLDDAEGGSRPYRIADQFWLGAGQYFLAERPQTGIALNNNNDIVRLYRPDGVLADEIGYSGAKKGLAFARRGNVWHWTTSPTPGAANEILKADEKTASAKGGSASAGTKKSAKAPAAVELGNIQGLEKGDLVLVRGRVAVLPGRLGSQIFYISGARGLQIYSNKKDFPPMKLGDLVEVRGEISVVNDELRLKTKTAADIIVLEGGEAPEPARAACAELGDEYIGRLVEAEGLVVERKGSTVFLDDGTEEAEVYLKKTAEINPSVFREGATARVQGIYARTSSGPKLMPRSPEDVEILGAAEGGGEVLGEVEEKSEWEPERPERNKNLYLWLSGLLVLALGAVIIIKRHRRKS